MQGQNHIKYVHTVC